MANNIIDDPDFEGFDGIFAGEAHTDFVMPTDGLEKARKLLAYMTKTNKNAEDLTPEEIEKFKFVNRPHP